MQASSRRRSTSSCWSADRRACRWCRSGSPRSSGRIRAMAGAPGEAVATGAALYATSLEDNSNLRLQLLDVIPMAIGLERAGGEFHQVFPRNAPIPNAKAIEATTSYDGQTEVAMRIFQGDAPQVAHNELLGDFLFSG